MIFEIDFNRVAWQTPENYNLLESIEGVFTEEVDMGKYGVTDVCFIDITCIEDLRTLEQNLMKLVPEFHGMLVGFDPNTIYLEL